MVYQVPGIQQSQRKSKPTKEGTSECARLVLCDLPRGSESTPDNDSQDILSRGGLQFSGILVVTISVRKKIGPQFVNRGPQLRMIIVSGAAAFLACSWGQG